MSGTLPHAERPLHWAAAMMQSRLVLSLLLPLVLAPTLAPADEPRPRSLTEYFDGQAHPGDVVCEPIQQTCYLAVEPPPVLTPEADPTGALAQGAIVPSQRPFTRVAIDQILGELERGRIKPSGPVDVYVRVDWSAKDTGLLQKSLGAHHFVHGRLSFKEGHARFEVTNVPDQLLLGMYKPSLDVAEVFGFRIGPENDQLRAAMNLWLETILARVLPAALGLEPTSAPRP